jgi:hypothetical protein
MRRVLITTVLALGACGGNAVRPAEQTTTVVDDDPEPVARIQKPEMTDDGRGIVHFERPWFCYLADDHIAGACYGTEGECEEKRTDAAVGNYSKCAAHKAFACFRATARLTGKDYVSCAPTLAQCDIVIANLVNDPDWKVPDRCSVVRVRR